MDINKAKSVIKTSIDLSNQEETVERFQPNFLSRFLVKAASNIQDKITTVIPENLKNLLLINTLNQNQTTLY